MIGTDRSDHLFFGALAANKPLVLPGVGKSGIDNLQGNRIVMVTKHHDPDPRRLRTSEKRGEAYSALQLSL